MKKIFYIFPLLALLLMTACEEELPETVGNIYGVVCDIRTGEPIRGASVVLSPGNQTTVTGSDGHFEFLNLEATQYKIQVSASGYNTNSKQVTVIAGLSVSGDIVMSPTENVDNVSLSNSNFNFGSTHTEQILIIKNIGNNGPINWEITNVDVSWLKVTPMSGSIAQGKEVAVKLMVDRTNLTTDEASTIFMVNAAGGSQSVRVNINKATITGLKGVVKDANDGHLIQDCLVTLTPSGESKATDVDGSFKFLGLSAGEYNLKFEKEGYPNKNVSVSVFTGEIKEVNVFLNPSAPFSLSEEMLDFGDSETNKTFTLMNNSDTETLVTITDVPSWLTLSYTEANLQSSSSLTINAVVDRRLVDNGSYSHNICISYTGSTQGEILLEIKFVKSSSPNNSNKWDGKIAKEFAAGSGSKGDPYIIKTGGQLLLMKDYSDKYFEIVNDIDLDNRNWLPIAKFSGKLNGNGHTIYNLRVERESEDCQYRGLIGSLDEGNITDLTIQGVKIRGNNAGAIAGNMKNAQITNCRVVLDSNSEIKGSEYLGGIVGSTSYSGSSYIEDCVVEYISKDDKNIIMGEKLIGGIAGYGHNISNCHVLNCNIIGEECVGGIVGEVYSEIKNCGYKGSLGGNKYLGGICGKAKYSARIFCCKSVSSIDCDDAYAAGVCSYGGEVISCYADGSIVCGNPSASYISGISNDAVNLSYSTVWCNYEKFHPICCSKSSIVDSYSIYETDNIAQKMEESYSDYAEYWNFDNVWTWSGTVNDRSKQVSCPRLFWE